MVNEIVLAIDPFLVKIEQILLWKNKLKTGAVFTCSHFLFWLFLNYNIRTYFTISSVFLVLHLLDAYRTKKRRELIRLQSINKNINENELTSDRKDPNEQNFYTSLSSLGKFIIYFNNKLGVVYTQLNRLKRRNRLLYFLTMLTFWSMTAIIGAKIHGYYLSYIVFWIIFVVPAIVHFDMPRKLLSRFLPLLEQLDHSMKYQRRSVLDKSELLVDVKHSNNDEHDEAEEDEYLRSFQLGDLKKKHRRIFDNLEDEESLYSEHTEDGEHTDEEDEEGEEIIEEVFEYQTYRKTDDGKRSMPAYEERQVVKPTKSSSPTTDNNYTVKTSGINFDFFDPNNDSLLPDEFMPNVNMSHLTNSFLNTTNEETTFDYTSKSGMVKNKRVKTRPSLLEYYGESAGNTSKKTPQNEQDIDETFDFLDEELDKY